MKKQFVILLAMLCNLFGSCVHAKPLPETPIESMEYRVDNATRYPTCHFILRLEADGHYRLTNGTNCDIENAPSIEVPASFADQLRQIVAEERMLSYKEDYSSWRHRHVCGGSAWKLYIRFVNSDTSVSSSGYMVRPKGNGLKRLESLCLETWKNAKQPEK